MNDGDDDDDQKQRPPRSSGSSDRSSAKKGETPRQRFNRSVVKSRDAYFSSGSSSSSDSQLDSHYELIKLLPVIPNWIPIMN